MKIVNVYIEHPLMQLNTTYSYLCNKDDIVPKVRVKVDFNGQKLVGFVDSVKSEQEFTGEYQLKMVEEIIDEKPLLNQELYDLGLWMSHQYISPAISCFSCMLPASLKPVSSFKNVVKDKYVKILDAELVKQFGDEIKLSEFKKIVSAYRYKKYKDNKSILVIEKEREAHSLDLVIEKDDFVLTKQQQQAIEIFNKTDKLVSLLHGLTGSGKTEVYIQLAKQVILQGQQVLILVPEISLTTQMIERFKKRFNNIAIYHSGLSNQEKYQQYKLVKENKVKIVVGTRSAIFMPFEKIGLIVLDEEHDSSYKQDNSPRYHTRDIAIYRAKYHKCKVLLGSATPSLESYSRAIKNVYQLITLDKRVNASLAKTTLVDMNQQIRSGNYIISKPLRDALENTLNDRKQAILLLNRRGYTPIMKCGSCSEVLMCPHCDVALSYHKDDDSLVCHVCGYSQKVNETCPKCGKKTFRNYGVGTQRLVEEVQHYFPQAKIGRMDADSTKTKDSHTRILRAFENGEYDILVGTQMISKGLDYPRVNLVGVFNADGPLNRTDYRSVETTFDLIVQASGRSGRNGDGQVFIQAYDVNHYGIVLASKQDYLTFFKNEMNYRHTLKYPPYTYLTSIVFTSLKQENSQEKAYQAGLYFRGLDCLRVLGPSQLLKKNDLYRSRIILKSTNEQEMIDLVWQWYRQQKLNDKGVSINIDVQPYTVD